MKTTRLYRIENIFGDGLYCSNGNLGTKLYERTIRDTDLYQDGKLREVRYHTRSGTPQVHRPFVGVDVIGVCNQKEQPSPEQLALDLNCEKIPPETFWDLVGRMSRKNPIYALDMRAGIQAYMDRMTQPELPLVWPDARVIKQTVTSGDSFTISDLIEFDQYGKHTQILACAEDNRPRPEEDGLPHPRDLSRDYHFAFASLEAMSEWLDGIAPKDIVKVGGVIRVMDVRDAQFGGRQVIFKQRDVMKEFRIVNGDLLKMAKGYH